MRKIQMVDLQSQYERIRDEINRGIQNVIESAEFVKGGKIVDFQHHLETYLGVKHVIPVGNGTDALQISLMALGLQSGDEVITPTFTFVSTVEVIALLGLKPVFVDVDPKTFCMSPQSVRNAVSSRTKAIIPVHLFGQNADMETLLTIAKEHNLFVVEDACQSIGAEYTFSNGRHVKSGCMGMVGCTSFFPSKNLGCYGDGGAIFTNNDALADEIRCIANHGMLERYHYDRIGVNSRLDSIQAAVLDVKLNYLDSYIASRQRAAAFYDTAFSRCQLITVPARNPQSTHVFHQYTIQLAESIDRDALKAALNEKGVPAMIYYPIPLHLQKAYSGEGYKIGDFPVAEWLSQSVLSLPMHTELDVEQLQCITDTVLSLVEQCKR
ncbi:MAG: DegT/DnrJ/EryC1/StrS family aminotransferase [Bacteroidales bacterium]|nr:DegT/DnrJ/EryC1/StrS family aminotransferase [Bacteroidales bacterium]